ncbi:MAG: putative transrane protein [Polaromonas sp.]|nr:putative transrane protein [Polaromonas sp.]
MQRKNHGQIIGRMNYLVALAFIAILASLGAALFFMMKDGTDGKRKTSNMARALAFRVGFSIVLFACILIAWKMGYIQPTGIPQSR